MTKKRWLEVFALLCAVPMGGVVACSGDGLPSELVSEEEANLVPSGFVDETVATGITNPTTMEFSPDGRLFVTQQTGQLRVLTNANPPVLLSTPFLSVTTTTDGERGLLGVAFDPNFAANRFVYVYYTATTPTVHNRVSRFTASASNPNVAQAGSEVVILELNDLVANNHNGGAIHFGPDGKLYVGVGENANRDNAQSLENLLGKLLRINADGSIPSDNPFFTQASGQNRAIWALGLRNPYNFAFQRGTGRLFLNDVGELTWEEINEGVAGSNYGWPQTEGPTTEPGVRAPLFAYGHGTGPTTGCAITGAAFYDPTTVQFPSSYVGRYFFADFCSGWIRSFNPTDGTVADFASSLSSVVDVKVANDGSLFYLQRGGSPAGQVHRVRSNQAPGGPLPNGNYRLLPTHIPSGTPARCVDVTGVSQESGADIIQWTCNGQANQLFNFTHLGSGIYEIRAVHSNLCMSVAGNSTADGADVVQLTCTATTGQRWLVRAVSGQSGVYELLAQTGSSRCLDVSGVGVPEGTDVIQWACNGGANQRFFITP